MIIPTIHISLYVRDDKSDKECHAAIESNSEGYIVIFAYGRPGKTLTIGIKTDLPLLIETTTKLLIRLVTSKMAKGYRPADGSIESSQHTGGAGIEAASADSSLTRANIPDSQH